MKLFPKLALVIGGIAMATFAVLNGSGAPTVESVGDVAGFEVASPATTTSTVTTTVSLVADADREVEPAVERSAIQFTVAEASQPAAAPTPVRLTISALGRTAPINPAGVASNGDMEVPDNVTDVAWYRFGPAPGEPGSAVLAAHVDLAGQGPGVFFELRELEPGDRIVVEFDDGSSQTYVTQARTIYDKTELPTEAIFRRSGPPVLTLITCGGGFNRQLGSYDSNVVVYAVPLADAELVPGDAD